MIAPTIDIKPWSSGTVEERQLLVEQVREVCHHVGFFYLINHGISQSQSDQYMTAIKAFFDLPEAEKQKLNKQNSPHFRGWEALGSELTNNSVDYREQVDIGPEGIAIAHPDPYYLRLVGPNQWPDETVLAEFKQTVSAFLEALNGVSHSLLQIMSTALGMAPNQIRQAFGGHPSPYAKLIRYPVSTDHQQGVGVHKDSGFLTLLLQDDQNGLEAQSPDGQWFRVNPVGGSLVVNIGELLQMLTHNFFVATPHRVICPVDKARYSSAYFYHPDLDMALHPLPIHPDLVVRARSSPQHRNAGIMPSRSEMRKGTDSMESHRKPDVFGVKYWERWVRSYPKIALQHHGDIVKD